MIRRMAKQMAASAWLTVPLLVAAALLTSRLVKRPVVVMDHWWNVAYATTGCEMRSKLHDACQHDPEAEVQDFEARVARHFTPSGDCGDVVLTTITSKNKTELPQYADADLRLKVNFSPDDSEQSWSIVRPADDNLTTGQGTPDEIAHRVCVIAKQAAAGHG
jgi:hypothetical protein